MRGQVCWDCDRYYKAVTYGNHARFHTDTCETCNQVECRCILEQENKPTKREKAKK